MALNAPSVGMARRNRSLLCMCSRNCIFDIIIMIIVLVVAVVMLQNRQGMVASFGYCSYSGVPPRVPIVGVPVTSGGRWVQAEV